VSVHISTGAGFFTSSPVQKGGLGLQLASNSPLGIIANGVVVGVFFLVYTLALLFMRMRSARQMEA
jgi:hypothetical protein